MAGSKDGINGIRWTIGILVPVIFIIVSAVFAISNSADSKLEKADKSLDDNKLEKSVFAQYEKGEKEKDDRMYKVVEKFDEKLDKILEKK